MTEKDDVIRLRKEGVGPTEIAQRLGMSRATVASIMRRSGETFPVANINRPSHSRERVFELHGQGLVNKIIAATVGASQGWVGKVLRASGRKSHMPEHSGPVGAKDPEMLEHVRQLYIVEGKSASETGAMLGISRGAVIGLAHRAGFNKAARMRSAGHKPSVPLSGRASNAMTRKAQRPKRTDVIGKGPASTERQAPRITQDAFWKPLEGSTPLTLVDMPKHACKWPCGDSTGADQLFCCVAIGEAETYCPSHAMVAYDQSRRKNYLKTPSKVDATASFYTRGERTEEHQPKKQPVSATEWDDARMVRK